MSDSPPSAGQPELVRLAADFPAYDFTLVPAWPTRARYVASARELGTHPHTLMTRDPQELRAELARSVRPGPRPAPE